MEEENKVMTNEERIEQLEQEIKFLKEDQKKIEKYKKLKEDADDAAIQAAIIKESFVEKGFTEEQAFQFMMQGMAMTRPTLF